MSIYAVIFIEVFIYSYDCIFQYLNPLFIFLTVYALIYLTVYKWITLLFMLRHILNTPLFILPFTHTTQILHFWSILSFRWTLPPSKFLKFHQFIFIYVVSIYALKILNLFYLNTFRIFTYSPLLNFSSNSPHFLRLHFSTQPLFCFSIFHFLFSPNWILELGFFLCLNRLKTPICRRAGNSPDWKR